MTVRPAHAKANLALRFLVAACACLMTGAASLVQAADPATGPPMGITAGSELDYPPYAIIGSNGEPDGFSVELLKAVAAEMRIDVSFRVGPWNQVLDEFRAGKLDVLPLFAVNPERAKYAAVTVPYLTVYGAVFVRDGEDRIHGFRDLPGKSVIVMKGDFGHEYALSHGLRDHLVTTPSLAEGMKLLASGEHDALLVSRLGGLQVLKQLGIKSVLPVGPPIEDYQLKFSLAVRKDNVDLLARLNEGLALIRTNGTFDRIQEKWLGVLDPRPVTFKDFLPYLVPASAILIALLTGLIMQRRLLILRERTEKRLRASQARLEAANKELDAFAYSVSHDLRAPLRGANSFARILQEKHAPQMGEDARHCVQMIRDNATQMGHLIDDLLAFSRLSQQPLKKELVRQEALVQAALEGLAAERYGRQIDLSIGELPPAEADPNLLKQVWANLIANAIKYTRGKSKAEIRIGSEIKNGVPVYFIQDNGVGFDMRYAHKLFGIFQRLHRAEEYEGTGVGLAIVQRIVTRHGGRIWAQAAMGQGATFYFTLQGEDGHA